MQGDEEDRSTHYLDTPAFHLQQKGFALRVRREGKDHKITLKHRTSDRYLAAAQDLSSSLEGERKFEEDIMPVFRSVFSQSNAVRVDKVPRLAAVDDAAKLFPGLAELGAPGRTELATVNGFEAHEVFCKLCKIRFKDKPIVKMGLSFWYQRAKDRWPLIAECAFDYETKKDDIFPITVVEGAKRLFHSLQNQPGWFNLAATTKTTYVYEGLV